MNDNAIELTCPLCLASSGEFFYQDKRDYFRCSICDLVFVAAHQFLKPEEEKAVYDQHENSAEDPKYRQFLSRIFLPLTDNLAPNSDGLDFGSGPGPTLSVMFQELGHSMKIYDPFYAPNINVFQLQYDFITASEVVEHLHKPRKELDKLWVCLKPQGILGIMTKRVTEQKKFSTWHYKNDPTHVCFFSTKTFRWLENYWGAILTIVDDDVVLFTKNE